MILERGMRNAECGMWNAPCRAAGAGLLGALLLGIWVFGGLSVSAIASPLDDKIAAFEQADRQTEASVGALLKAGLDEHREAEAVAVIRPWLAANTVNSPSLLYWAGRAMQFSGEWSDAVIFYRKLLKSKSLDARLAATVVPTAYRLLINDMRDAESAYLFMREDGNRLRDYGSAKQFDRWFLREAISRGDVRALAERLAAIHGNPKEDPKEYAEFMRQLYKELETFQTRDADTTDALDELARVASREPGFKARWNWINAVSRYNTEALKVNIKREEPAQELLEEPLKAARALVSMDPVDGAALVVKGWSRWNQGDTPTFFRFVHAHDDLKAQVFIEALQRLSPEQAKAMLNAGATCPRGRSVSVAGFISPAKARSVVPRFPAIFNAIDAPAVGLWHGDMTVAEAKTLAPHLARNPHEGAALVRAYAVAGTNLLSKVLPAMAKSESWRFVGDGRTSAARRMVDAVWNSGCQRDGDHGKLVKQYEKQSHARRDQLRKQIAKQSDSKSRMAAFDALYKELLGNPSTPGVLGLWDDLFQKAPNPDKAAMLTRLSSDLHATAVKPARDAASLGRQNELEYLLKRVTANAWFGKNNRYAALRLSPNIHDRVYHNWRSYGVRDLRSALSDFAAKLDGMLRKQIQQNVLSEPMLSMWMHCVDPNSKDARSLIDALKKTAPYGRLPVNFHEMAAHDDLFGHIALTDKSATDPRRMSRELLELPGEATAQQVEVALKAVMTRVSQAAEPVQVIGLHKVAVLPELKGETRKLVLALFDGQSPLGAYPSRQGYEQLGVRLIKEAQDAAQWGGMVPYAASLWRTCASPDDARYPHVANALTGFAEAALAAGKPSVAMSVARSGLESRVGGIHPDHFKTKSAELRGLAGRAAVAIGVVDIPVDETDPAYGIYKSNSDFIQGNLDSAWALYLQNDALLMPKPRGEEAEEKPLLRKLSVEYGFWLLQRNIEEGRTEEAEALVKELTIWSRLETGLLGVTQEAELKIAYADLAFRKGALPTSRAWYRKVADAREYRGSEVYVRAALGSVMIDRVSKNFGAALEELDKLLLVKVPGSRSKVHYARAEVFMDQEAYKEALEEVEAVLRRDPSHEDARILRGKIEILMRRLVEASEIELGLTRENKVMVPGEVLKINLFDPTLSVSGVGADIEVEVWAKSGDRERVMLHQLGDNKEKFRADVPTALAPPVKGDKTLQVLGVDEIRFGYSKRFRDKMKDLPPDPTTVITIASDAHLSFSAGAFPPRKGERKLDIEELGLSTAQRKLGMRTVRPGNPVYLRIIDGDQSKTAGIDELAVSLETSSGDVIRRLILKETGPFTGEFEGIIPTAGAQAMAFASESAPGRDPNMAISSKDYPGWLGNVGDKDKARTFGVDLNDNVPLDRMTIDWLAGDQAITHFVLQTSLNGRGWVTRARFPEDKAPWDGRPRVCSIPTFRGGIAVSTLKGRTLPGDWQEKMTLHSASASCGYLAAHVPSLSAEKLPIVNTGHPGYSGLLQYRALFYQPDTAPRRFKLNGYPAENTVFLIDGAPADAGSDDPMIIERELTAGLHEIQVWRHEGRSELEKRKPVLLCDVPGKEELVPCPDSMFAPSTFPEGVRAMIPQPASITNAPGGIEVSFGDTTQARMVRLSIQGFQGVAPGLKTIRLTGRDGKSYLPVAQDFMALRENKQLEVLPGDQIVARYEDAVTATPKRDRHEGRLGVAFNTAQISASFLNYETTSTGRQLIMEPIRRFNLEDAVAIVVDDVDMDGSPERDVIEFMALTSAGRKTKLKAVETEEHSGRFVGRIFPVTGEPQRESELQVPEGGTLTLTYRDMENLDPGIPTDRSVTIEHAKYITPKLGAYTAKSEWMPELPPRKESGRISPNAKSSARKAGPEVIEPRRTISYHYVAEPDLTSMPLMSLVGGRLMFDVVAPHLALAQSSEISAYVQTDAGRKRAAEEAESGQGVKQPFDISVPGTMKLTAVPRGGGSGSVPPGYKSGFSTGPAAAKRPLDEGRFTFSVPLILGDRPGRSFATRAEEMSGAEAPDGLVVQAGDTVHIGYAWKDENDQVQWKTAEATVGSHAFLDVMNASYNEPLDRVFVGERVFLRVLAPGLDRGPERDWTSVELKATSGAVATFKLRETLPHSGTFKGVFTVNYADDELPAQLPPVELNGFPVRYGDEVVITYAAFDENPQQKSTVAINRGADGEIEPFSKRFTGDAMAVKTSFTLAECFFELAKKHRKMDQESLARREMDHAKKLLQEAIATHRDDELRAQAEYLLGNLSQEYADLSKNEASKLPAYQEALGRFVKIPVDYPNTEFAHKAQFKIGLVYEKMGEGEIAVEEYVKLAYKYPDSEHIPEVMTRLGKYFQAAGQVSKEQADPLREKEDLASKAEVLRLDELSYPEFIKAAIIYGKLQDRFPDHKLAGLAGLASAQNYMRAHQYDEAIDGFTKVVDNEDYDDNGIRAQALYWSGLSYERVAAAASVGDYKTQGNARREAYETYRRVTFDFPDSKWAKYARGRLADAAFARIIEEEEEKREKMLEALEYQKRKRQIEQNQKKIMDKLLDR